MIEKNWPIAKPQEKSKSLENNPKEFLNWEEKNSYVAKELVANNSKDVLSIIDSLVDDDGNFLDFLEEEHAKKLMLIMKDVAFDKKVKNGLYNPEYGSIANEKTTIDSDYGRVLIEALPAIFQNNLEKKQHDDNISIIQSWAQTENYLLGEEDRLSNIANVKGAFEKPLVDNRISVLEKIYLNYIGNQFNQLDAEDLKNFLPEAYREFKDEQPSIERFRKEIPDNFQLNLSPKIRRSILLEKLGEISVPFSENDWRGEHCERNLLYIRERQHKIKSELFRDYENADNYNKPKILEKFAISEEGQLLPCRGEINTMELIDTDGEYLVSNFSQDYDGVYSVAGSLEALIRKGDLESKNPVDAIEFAEVKKEINFYNSQDIASFKIMSSLFFRDALEKKCGVDIAQLNLRTQYQFLNFIKEYNEDQFQGLKEFMDNSGSAEEKSNRLKSFLCLELDKNLGAEMVSVGEKLPPVQADLFFSKIAMINDLACAEESELGQLLLKDDQDLDFSVLKSELLKRARGLVLRFSSLIDDKLSEEELVDVFSELENIQQEMVLFSSLLKSAKENKQNINLDTIKNLNLNIKDYGQELSEKEKEQILNIATDNWDSFGNEKMSAAVLAGLKEAILNNKEQKAYILKYKDDVIGFVRFEKTDHGTIYAGSFNVSKDLRGLSIGNDLMEKVLIAEGKNNILEAAAPTKISASCSYVEKVGFVADGLIDDYHKTSEKMFSIKLDNSVVKNQMSREEIKANSSDYQDLERLIGNDIIILHFDILSEAAEYENALTRLLAKTDDNLNKEEDNKYLLTRYFQDKDLPGDVRYLVFEKA